MKRILPPTLMLICLAAIILLRMDWPLVIFLSFPANMIGIIPLGVGYLFLVYSLDEFKLLDTTLDTFEQPARLVVVGLYRYTRNPMYLGFVLMLAGISLLLGALSPFIGVLLFFLITDRWYVAFEEKVLETRFGRFYDTYKRRTRRWF